MVEVVVAGLAVVALVVNEVLMRRARERRRWERRARVLELEEACGYGAAAAELEFGPGVVILVDGPPAARYARPLPMEAPRTSVVDPVEWIRRRGGP